MHDVNNTRKLNTTLVIALIYRENRHFTIKLAAKIMLLHTICKYEPAVDTVTLWENNN